MFFPKRNTKQVEQREISVNNVIYRLTIYYEQRNNSRVSITKTGIHVRIPIFLPKEKQQEQIQKLTAWAENNLRQKGHFPTEEQRVFRHNQELKLYDKTYLLQIENIKENRIKAKIENEQIQIKLAEAIPEEAKQKNISKTLTKLLVNNYHQKISEKLHHFNQKFQFGDINTIRLKNNSSNWGSCSSKNNINISIRLLLAPEFVVDYVLIHELVHLQHRNHSKAFWSLVAKCCPQYQKAEVWLKKNGKQCII